MTLSIGLSEYTKPGLVLVEGKDDECLVDLLLTDLAAREQVDIIDMRGRDRWPTKVGAIVRTRGFSRVSSLLLIMDSDADSNGAFNSMTNAIRLAGLPTPAQQGEWAHGAGIATAAYTLPRPGDAGELEDLCVETASGRPQDTCVQAAAASAVKLSNPPKKLAKFKLQVFIASHPEVYDTFAAACRAKVFDPAHQAFEPLRALLRAMAE